MSRTFFVLPSLFSVFAIVVACGSSDDASAPPSPDGGNASSSSGSSADGGTSSSSSSSGGPSGVYVPAQPGAGTAYCDSTFGKLLAKFPACCSSDDQNTQDYKLSVGILTLAVQQCAPRFERAINAGRLEIDEAAAQTCYAAYADAVGTTCTPGGVFGLDPKATTDPALAARLAACKVVFRGKVAENGACAQEVDCLDGLTCVGYTTDADGTCKQPPALNESCGEAASDGGVSVTLNLNLGVHPKCATGAWCSARKCAAQSDPGESCVKDEACAGGKKCHNLTCGDEGDADQNGACKSNDDCKTGLYCQGVDGGALGSCQPKLSDGAACNSTVFNPECKGRCDKPEGGGAGTCKSLCGSG